MGKRDGEIWLGECEKIHTNMSSGRRARKSKKEESPLNGKDPA